MNKISIREYLRNYNFYNSKVIKGESFVIVKNNEPQIMLSPIQDEKKYTIKDLLKIRFSGDKNLSKNIDKIVYGL